MHVRNSHETIANDSNASYPTFLGGISSHKYIHRDVSIHSVYYTLYIERVNWAISIGLPEPNVTKLRRTHGSSHHKHPHQLVLAVKKLDLLKKSDRHLFPISCFDSCR